MTVNAFADPYKNTVVQASLPKTPTYSGTYRGYVLSGITLSSPVLLEVDYYDAYGFAGTSPFPAANNADFAYDSSIGSSFSAYYSPSAQGLQTGSLLKVLDNTAGNQYLWSVSYFDDKCRVVQHRASTHLGGVEKDWFLYDFTGNATKRKTEHKPSSGTSLIETATQTYNTWGHPVKTTHKLGSGTAQVVSNRTYDKAGRLATDKRNGTAALKTTFSYNIRSWVTGISGSLFTETLNYQDAPPVRWGGDVSKVSWTDGQSSNLKSYTLAYDTIGRLKTASFSDAGNASANFTEKVTQYDGNGNIKKLERYGRTGASTYGKIDDLVYTYSGNKATSIKDTGAAAYSSDFRFSNGTNNTYSYSYDAAGRITADASKGISSITWNVLGLPQTVTFSSGAVINYSYAADGTKLRESRTASSTRGAGERHTVTAAVRRRIHVPVGQRLSLLPHGPPGLRARGGIGQRHGGGVRPLLPPRRADREVLHGHKHPAGEVPGQGMGRIEGPGPLRLRRPSLRPRHGPLALAGPPGGEVLRPFAVSLLRRQSDEVCRSEREKYTGPSFRRWEI